MSVEYCPKCNAELVEDAEFCHECGFAIVEEPDEEEIRHCPKCNAELVEGAPFCHKCGERVNDNGEKGEQTDSVGDEGVDEVKTSEPAAATSDVANKIEAFAGKNLRLMIVGACALGLIIIVVIALTAGLSPRNRLIGEWHHFYSDNVEEVLTIGQGGKCHMKFLEDGKENDDYLKVVDGFDGYGTWSLDGDKVEFRWEATEFEGLKADDVVFKDTGTITTEAGGDCLVFASSRFYKDKQRALESYRISENGRK